MRNICLFVYIFFLFLFLFPFTTHQIYAGTFSNTTLRLDTQSANADTGGLICVQTPSVSGGTVAKVQVTFPSGFSVNSNASNWTVNTSNLPAGATAWPGIGTANLVNGQAVTFPSGNLSTSTYYCFNFSATNTLATGSAGDNYNGTISTQNSSAAQIDSKSYAVSTVANDKINVNGTIATGPADFTAILTSNTSGIVQQNSAITYTLTYGSSASLATDITIEAQWSLGTISGQGSPTINLLDYVQGSASNAYAGATPIIDTVNNKIDWTIPSFPANTSGQTVNFQLATNSSYTGSSQVSFTTSGRLISGSSQTADSNVNSTYQYNAGPTPTAGSSLTPTPILPSAFSFSNISVRSISATNSQINVDTTNFSKVRVLYGSAPNNLSKSVLDSNYSSSHQITLSALVPNQNYYFKVRALNTAGNLIISNIYTFKTAVISIAPEIDYTTVILTSDNNVIASNINSHDQITEKNAPIVVLPQNTGYQVTFSLAGRQSVKRAQAILRNKNVLGIKSVSASANDEQNTEVVEIQPGVYVARLLGQPKPGNYSLFIIMYDNNGNIAEQKIADIKIVAPFTIYSKLTNKPIEGAKVLLYIHNEFSKTFILTSGNSPTSINPSYSGVNGTVNMILAPGKYKAEVSSIGYKPQTLIFSINSTSDYPQIYLIYTGFNFFNQIQYYSAALLDFARQTRVYLLSISQSIRFFELNMIIAISCLVFLTLFSLSRRIHIPLHSFFDYFLHLGRIKFAQKKLGERIKGRVYDKDSADGIANAQVFLIDTDRGAVVGHCKTNILGEFTFLKISGRKYQLEVIHDEYEPVTFNESKIGAIGLGGYSLNISKHGTVISIKEKALNYARKIISVLFETLLVLSFVFEFSMGLVLGWPQVLPFFLISVVSLSLWIIHLSHERSERNIF